jgi:predicted DsbA family dithiol-disulfide isomerase
MQFLKSDELKEDVYKLAGEVRSKGITGIPVTFIDGKWALSGSQASETYVQVCLIYIFIFKQRELLTLR